MGITEVRLQLGGQSAWTVSAAVGNVFQGALWGRNATAAVEKEQARRFCKDKMRKGSARDKSPFVLAVGVGVGVIWEAGHVFKFIIAGDGRCTHKRRVDRCHWPPASLAAIGHRARYCLFTSVVCMSVTTRGRMQPFNERVACQFTVRSTPVDVFALRNGASFACLASACPLGAAWELETMRVPRV